MMKSNSCSIHRYSGDAYMDLSTIENPMTFTHINIKYLDIIKEFGYWRINAKGYVVCATLKLYKEMGYPATMLLHRLLMGFHRNRILPSNEEVDHINLDRLDNRVENLRICSHADNCKNKSMWKKSPGKFKGTIYRPRRKTWTAQISIEGRNFYIGTFKTEMAAAVAYNHKADTIRKQFANLNPISDWQDYDYEKHRIKKKKLNLKKFKKINSF